MEIINALSLVLEIVTALLGLKIALVDKKPYGSLIAITFVIYVVYDLDRFISISLPAHELLFFAASLSICSAVLMLAKGKN